MRLRDAYLEMIAIAQVEWSEAEVREMLYRPLRIRKTADDKFSFVDWLGSKPQGVIAARCEARQLARKMRLYYEGIVFKDREGDPGKFIPSNSGLSR